MARRPSNPGSWPRLMRAETAAAYVDEKAWRPSDGASAGFILALSTFQGGATYG
jgi:hypothetical protein